MGDSLPLVSVTHLPQAGAKRISISEKDGKGAKKGGWSKIKRQGKVQ